MPFKSKIRLFIYLTLVFKSNLLTESRNPFLASAEPDFQKIYDFVIKGIAYNGETWAAILSNNIETRIVKIGDKIKNYLVQGITNTTVILKKNDKECILYFNESETLK